MSLNIDKSTWKRVAFGDVIDSITDRVDNPSEAGVDRYVGLEHLDPGVMTVQRWDSPDKVEAQKLRFQPGDVIFGRRRAYQKKVAKAEFEGICSAHALVLRARPDYVDPDFLPVFLSSDYFLERAIEISVGSLSPTVNWRDLKVQEFNLPPWEEQKRIANLLWAVERQKVAIKTVGQQIQSALQFQMASSLEAFGSTVRLGQVASIRSGPSFAASDVSPVALEGSIPVLGIPNTRPDGTFNITDVGHVSGLAASTGTVDEASLILIRTNGNRQRIGNVYLPPTEAYGYAVSAFQFLMKVTDPSYREYLYWVLSTDTMQERMSEAASGTTGLGNLAVKWLNEQEVPWSATRADRDRFLTMVNTYVTARDAISAERTALASLRFSLLADVFGGN
ncbi:restriction endonuclease subunit S [Arthrobacter sp. B1805]|uniref:restriction endonuclease subunit S n=1 Tax=Arthrobacter sp. B1805 TaxID=2058892 RepID=UPI000CE577B8|nr:restriction endonuclease subunit S [Arthrobacter sp. B1805]